MAKLYLGNTQKKKIYLGNTQIKKVYKGNTLVFSSAHVVTYRIDTNNIVTKEVEDGADCIANAPSVSVSGYTLQGWREDTTASASVLSSKTCDSDGIVLYAVLKQTITLSYNGNGSTSGSTANQTGTRYYNNGNASNPSFTLRASGYARTNYTFAQWSMGSTSGTKYKAGASVTLSSNTTFYAFWVQTVTNFGYTGGVQSYAVQASGVYKLEAAGGKGSNVTISAWGVDVSGGAGGISSGNVALNAGDTVYVCVGGAGTYPDNGGSAGYNGGGTGSYGHDYGYYTGAGGGATHFAKTNRGTLPSYASYVSELYLVAGGGGGALYVNRYTPPDEEDRSTYQSGYAGNDTTEYVSNLFGQGANGDTTVSGNKYGQSTDAAGGGGGYRGGAAMGITGTCGGGSGYVGGCISGTTSIQTGGNSGNGYARITLVSVS